MKKAMLLISFADLLKWVVYNSQAGILRIVMLLLNSIQMWTLLLIQMRIIYSKYE